MTYQERLEQLSLQMSKAHIDYMNESDQTGFPTWQELSDPEKCVLLSMYSRVGAKIAIDFAKEIYDSGWTDGMIFIGGPPNIEAMECNRNELGLIKH